MPPYRLTGWRRIAGAMWDAPTNPQIFGALDVDARPIQAFLAEGRARGHHVTPTHLVGRAVAHALARCPDMNVRLLAGYALPRDSIDIFFHAAVEGGDLSGVKIERADQKSAVELAAELGRRAAATKQGRDPSFQRTKRIMDRLPMPALRAAVRLSSFLTGTLDLDLPALGLTRRPFGSAAVTSIGMLGLPSGFAPLTRAEAMPLLVCVGEIVDRPVAVAGRAEVLPVLPVTATLDHRYVDGWHIRELMRHFRAYLADPSAFEPPW